MMPLDLNPEEAAATIRALFPQMKDALDLALVVESFLCVSIYKSRYQL